MNIGLFSDCYLPTRNGVSQAVRHLKEGLEERGHRVVLVTVSDPDRESCTARRTGAASLYTVPSLPFKPSLHLRAGLISAGTARRIILQEGLDIIHTHTEFAVGRAGRKAGTMLQIPIVHTFHTFYEDYLHFLPFGGILSREFIQRHMARFLRPFQAVVCPSRKSQEYLRGILPRDTTRLIPNGVPLSSPAGFQEDWSLPIGGSADRADKKIILSVGRLSPEKRSLQLVSRLIPLLEKRPDLELILVGEGPLRRSIQNAIRRRGLGGRILMTGSLPHGQVQTLYKTADLFITASLSENHPLSLLEAAVAGLPFVIRDDPGGLDLVQEGINGFRTSADGELPNAVMRLLDNPGLRREFGNNSRTIIREFSRELCAARVEELYLRCLGCSPEAAPLKLFSMSPKRRFFSK